MALPRRPVLAAMLLVVLLATVTAILETLALHRSLAPLAAVAILVGSTLSLVRGALSSSTSARRGWINALVLTAVPLLSQLGVNPAFTDYVTEGWYCCGVLIGASLLRMGGRVASAVVTAVALMVETASWAGLEGLLRLGLLSEAVIFSALLILQRELRRIIDVAVQSKDLERAATVRRVEREAFQAERKTRLERAGREATPVLRALLAHAEGPIDAALRFRCQVLEQTIRDEIRGRRLMHNGVREVVLSHRLRGAVVQVLDDGGLDDLPPDVLDELLCRLVEELKLVTSNRIVIRTAPMTSTTAITLVATSADEVALALGLDDAIHVDMSTSIARPTATEMPISA